MSEEERRRTSRRVSANRRVSGQRETMRAVLVQQWGDPSVLEASEVEVPEPAPGEALVRVDFAGVNYTDVYHRTGLYPKEPPFIPGVEASGVVEKLGAGAEDAAGAAAGAGAAGVAVGDRVAFAMGAAAYAEYVTVPAWKLVEVPEAIPMEIAAAVMVQGMTADFLSSDAYPILEGDTVLIHAAAGGVGLLLTQLAKKRGAVVIGTCSTEEKAKRVRAVGADHVVLYTEDDFVDATNGITDGKGVAAVYDSVGRATFDRSIDCLAPRGFLLLFGQASGPVAPVDPQILARQGSIYLTRPSLVHYMRDAAEARARAGRIFSYIQGGQLDVHIHCILDLTQAAEAHELLESRRTSGKLLLSTA
ncbi:MAG TPA: quinone oxidoreductase [Longimicrobiales bacterium]|nr:quinone oxidoreductase [Longimicrobiales bacterium]